MIRESGGNKSLRDRVLAFLNSKNTWLDLECDDSGQVPSRLNFATRNNGSIWDEAPGAADIRHAIEMKKALYAEFGDEITVKVETVDEWTDLEIILGTRMYDAQELQEKLDKVGFEEKLNRALPSGRTVVRTWQMGGTNEYVGFEITGYPKMEIGIIGNEALGLKLVCTESIGLYVNNPKMCSSGFYKGFDDLVERGIPFLSTVIGHRFALRAKPEESYAPPRIRP